MRKEAGYLITLCKAYLYGDTVKLDEDMDYNKLFSLSKAHNLSAVVFCVINTSENKEVVPSDVFKAFQNTFYDSVMRYNMQGQILSEADRLLEENSIKHVFFKGAEIREYYPVPQARVMGDIDLLISEEDRERVKKALCGGGFKLVNSNGPVYDYEKEQVKIEAHTKIISEKIGSVNTAPVMKDAVGHAEFNGFTGRLDINFHFAYLIAHLAHHFWFYGAGIRLVLDLAVIEKSFEPDYEKINDLLSSVSLDKFGKIILSVCFKWFGTGKSYTDDTEETEKFLMSYGVFGNSNRNRSAVIERKEMEEGKTNSPFMTRLRLLFPSYSKLRDIPYMKFIEGRPYLTPSAWIYRIVYNLKNRREFVRNATKDIGSDESKKEAERELAFFKEIGLWQH